VIFTEFENLTVVLLKIQVFWKVHPLSASGDNWYL